MASAPTTRAHPRAASSPPAPPPPPAPCSCPQVWPCPPLSSSRAQTQPRRGLGLLLTGVLSPLRPTGPKVTHSKGTGQGVEAWPSALAAAPWLALPSLHASVPPAPCLRRSPLSLPRPPPGPTCRPAPHRPPSSRVAGHRIAQFRCCHPLCLQAALASGRPSPCFSPPLPRQAKGRIPSKDPHPPALVVRWLWVCPHTPTALLACHSTQPGRHTFLSPLPRWPLRNLSGHSGGPFSRRSPPKAIAAESRVPRLALFRSAWHDNDL